MLILKFHIRTPGNRIYIEEEAKLDNWGHYKDKEFVYLKDGKVPRSLIEGDIEECYVQSEEENGQDYLQ